MVANVSFDTKFSKRLLDIEGPFFGVLLGGVFDTCECLFLSVQIPKDEEFKGVKSENFTCIEDVDENWVGSFCKNLSRMIPGGVHISGICLSLDPKKFTDYSSRIRKILSHTCPDDPCLLKLIDITQQDKYVLMMDPVSKKFSCKAINVNDAHTSFRNVVVKVRDIFDSWVAFKTHISLSMETTLPSDRKKEKILYQFQSSVEPYLQSLTTQTQLLINGKVYQEHEALLKDLERPSKKSKVTKKPQNSSVDINRSNVNDHKMSERELDKFSFADMDVVIFGPQFPQWQRANSSSSLDSGGSSDTNLNSGNETPDSSSSGFVPINRLVLSGRVPGIAYLPTNSTVGQLMQALRQDLVQSLLARLQLLSEELHITNADFEVSRMLLPQRVLIRLPVCPTLPLSDYKFVSETADDVVNRLVYFCLPLGVKSSGEVGSDGMATDDVDDADLVDGFKQSKFSYFGIDASCLDTTLENNVEVSADDELSESEVLDQVVESIPSSSRLKPNFTLLNLVAISVLVLILGVFLAHQQYESG